MGIKFFCPQGHKLHVKSFLAGKKGVCPRCGTKVRIPLESQRGGKDDDGSPEPEESDISSEDRDIVPVATPTSPIPAAGLSVGKPGAGPKAPTPATRGIATSPLSGGSTTMPAVSIPVVQAAGIAPVPIPSSTVIPASFPAPVADPFAEAPNGEWYICPPSGGRYGPANAQILKRWVTEGRVTPDSLVWRSGWSDWKPAASVLPGVPASGGSQRSPAVGTPPSPVPMTAAPAMDTVSAPSTRVAATSASANYIARKKSASSLGVILVLLLGTISVALLAALIWVLGKKS